MNVSLIMGRLTQRGWVMLMGSVVTLACFAPRGEAYAGTAAAGTRGGLGLGQPFYGGFFPYYFPTTWDGNVLLGSAFLTRGAGQFVLDTSMAAVNYQDAYKKGIDNAVHGQAAYIEMRRRAGSYHDSLRRPTPTSEQIAGYNRQRAPKRLTADQLDGRSGQIHWPAILLGEEFAQERAALERLFAARSSDPGTAGPGTPEYHEVLAWINEMQALLKDEIRQMRPAEFLAGRKFLTSLAYEARLMPEGPRLLYSQRPQ